MQFAAIIAVLAILSGGVSFAADRALPGDALYAVKVNVNEEVRAALALSANAKAKLNAQLAAERLKEATALAAEGRLNAETEAELRSSFQASANEAQVQIQALKLSGKANIAAEINEDFVSNLEAQARAMAAVSGSAATTAAASAGALVDLATTVNSILDASVDSEIQL